MSDTDPRLVDLDEALATAAEFDDVNPALADLMRAAIARGAREARDWGHVPGVLSTALHALQQADAEYAKAADSDGMPLLAYAMHRLRDLRNANPDDAGVRAAWLLISDMWVRVGERTGRIAPRG